MSEVNNTGGLTAGNTTASLLGNPNTTGPAALNTTGVVTSVTPVSKVIPATTVPTEAQTLEAFETLEERLWKTEARLLVLEAKPTEADVADLKATVTNLHQHLKQLIDPYNRRRDI